MTSQVDVVSAGTRALRFLTNEDQRLPDEQAQHARFNRGDVILAEGVVRQAVFPLRKGFVRVERAHMGRGIAIARRGVRKLVECWWQPAKARWS